MFQIQKSTSQFSLARQHCSNQVANLKTMTFFRITFNLFLIPVLKMFLEKLLPHLIYNGNTSLQKKIDQASNTGRKRKQPLVKGKEKSIIISGWYWAFLQVSFHCSIFHQS